MILGLTGGIASGKSTVSRYFASKGISIVDADAISRDITKKGQKGAEAIREVFGEEFFVCGELDRKKLASFCFGSPENTEKLNALLHPIIIDEIETQLKLHAKEKLTVLDAPLLIESGLHKRCDKVLTVICDRETRIRRAVLRSPISENEVRDRIDRQISDSERIKYSDFIIDNGGTVENTLAQADKILKELNI